MLGDVASHGFSAALVMALVMSAAGIHAAASITPDETLTALLESLSTELATTEMYFSVFYGVLDPLTRPAVLRQCGPSLCLPRAALRRPRAARGHGAAAGPRHGRQHPAPPGAMDRRPRSPGALDRRSGGRAERGRASRSASSGCWRRSAPDAPTSPEEIVAAVLDGGGRRSALSRSTTARCWSSGSSGAPRQAPAGPAFSHRSPDFSPASPTRSAPVRTTPCSRSAPVPAGSPPQLAERAGRLVAIEKDRDLVPALRRAVPRGDDRRGRRARGRLAVARRAGVPRRRQHPLQHHVAAHRQGARAAATRADRVPGAEGSRRPGDAPGRASGRTARSASASSRWREPSGCSRCRRARSIRGRRWTPRCCAWCRSASRWWPRRQQAELSPAGGGAVRLPPEAAGARAARADRMGGRIGWPSSLSRVGSPAGRATGGADARRLRRAAPRAR